MNIKYSCVLGIKPSIEGGFLIDFNFLVKILEIFLSSLLMTTFIT